MNNTPLFFLPLSIANALVDALEQRFVPPPWAIEEMQTRVVLLLNHVLQQEPEAMRRLARAKSKQMLVQWRSFSMILVATPVGLLDRPASLGVAAKPDLTITLLQHDLAQLAQTAADGSPPQARIEGDVQLAAEVGWLTQHVRWDIEEDLSKLLGDVPAHTLAKMARGAADALRRFALRPTAT